MEKSINKFEFKIAAWQDLPAIWFIPKKKEVCVFPPSSVTSIFQSG